MNGKCIEKSRFVIIYQQKIHCFFETQHFIFCNQENIKPCLMILSFFFIIILQGEKKGRLPDSSSMGLTTDDPCPRRPQPRFSELVYGPVVAVFYSLGLSFLAYTPAVALAATIGPLLRLATQTETYLLKIEKFVNVIS